MPHLAAPTPIAALPSIADPLQRALDLARRYRDLGRELDEALGTLHPRDQAAIYRFLGDRSSTPGDRAVAGFGDWLKEARRKAGLTQERLAQLAGFSRTYMPQLEANRVRCPEPQTRAKLHAILGTSDDELIALGIIEGGAS